MTDSWEVNATSRRRCVFCGASKVSLEHVWPIWMRDMIAEQLGKASWLSSHEGAKTRVVEVIEATVKRVCRKCNDTWMSEIENAAKPLLSCMMFGEFKYVELLPVEQEALATWAFKTALMAAFFYPKERFSLQTYAQFYASKRPPENAYIWTAAYGGPRARLETLLGPALLEVPAKDLREPFALHGALVKHGRIATLGILSAVFQVLVHYATATRLVVEDMVVLQRIWPPQDKSIVWPFLGRSLSEADFERLGSRTGFMRPRDVEPR